jgi:periplasmic divalent cation tolerance protein
MSDYVEVITTTETQDDARRIARALVESRLAACVQIRGPIESTYRWKGAIETAEEWQCVAKTRGELFAQVEGTIARLHTYEVPEILAVPIVEASRSYAEWLDGQVGPQGGTGS